MLIRKLACAMLISLVCVILPASPVVAASQKAGVHDLKAAYIFNFIRFTDWPETAGNKGVHGITLQVLGDEHIYRTMQAIVDNPVAKKIGLQVGACDQSSCMEQVSALFIGEQATDYERLLHDIQNRPILTISDRDGFATHGGMIEINYKDNRLDFLVNIDAVRASGLYISAQLLQLGRVIGSMHE